MKRFFTLSTLSLLVFVTAMAQELTRIPNSSMWMLAPVVGATQVPYDYDGDGIEYRVRWGMDTAWNDRNNIVRGTYHIGRENLSYGRVSFQPTDSVGDDLKLSNAQQRNLNSRINNMKRTGVTSILLNSDPNDPDKLAKYYYGKPKNWYNMIKATAIACQQQGMTVEAIAPMNEPDYTYNGQGTKEHFRQVVKLMREDPFFDNIRICAGNTLNPDPALEWYNYMKPYVDEGNTHQLAGSFDNYAKFFQTVRADGKIATADELHNTMEAFVAVEYGLQNGIWWGYEGVTRGRYCKATSGGRRLGYGESRRTWTAGCVYRLPDGSVDAFLGSSERQANTNTFELVCQDRDVFYDGYGPTRFYTCEIPGGTGYQVGQTNAETTIHITTGEDVADGPIANGQYFIMNSRNKSVMIMSTSNNSSNAADVMVSAPASKTRNDEIWTIEAVPARVGGDFCYHFVTNKTGARLLDVKNSNLNNNGDICAYPGGKGAIEQWHFIYASNGDYYIQSRYSGLFLGVNNNRVVQREFNAEDLTQRWRLVPVDTKCETSAPAAPAGLTATPQSASVLLNWEANTEDDFASYTILRGEATTEQGENWQTIGRQLTDTQFIDNACVSGQAYLYKLIAVDKAGNRSEASELVASQTIAGPALIARYTFDHTLLEESENIFDAVAPDNTNYMGTDSYHKEGTASVAISNNKYIMLPHEVGDQREMTIAMWLRWRGGNNWERIFDFGCGPDRYFYLTPSNDDKKMAFGIKNGGDEQTLVCEEGLQKNKWHHVALTIGATETGMDVKVYVDGEIKGASTDITLSPADIRPGLCYLGRGQSASDPFMTGYIDDLRFYNYPLPQEEIQSVMESVLSGIDTPAEGDNSPIIGTEYYSPNGVRIAQPTHGLVIIKEKRADGSTTTRKVVR